MPFSANDVKLMLLKFIQKCTKASNKKRNRKCTKASNKKEIENVQRLQTRKEIEKVLGLCTFLNKIWKQEFDVISGKRHLLDLLKGCID